MTNTSNPTPSPKEVANKEVHEALDPVQAGETHPLEGEVPNGGVRSTPNVDPRDLAVGSATANDRLGIDSVHLAGASPSAAKAKRGKGPRIESLEQFIAHAYTLKGRHLTLSPKLERILGAQGRLPTDARQRLLDLSAVDAGLQVNRQLLIVARRITAYPAFRGELREYAGEVLLRHSAFARPELQACIRNLPGSPQLSDAFELLLEGRSDAQSPKSGKRRAKSKPLGDVRQGVVYCLAVWVAETRGISNAALSDALYTALWAPAARRIRDDIGRLHAITELRDATGVGAACAVFSARASEQTSIAAAAQREAQRALEEMEGLRAAIEALERRIADRDETISSLNRQVDELRVQHETAMIHARDDHEQLRTRVLRRLKADVALLEDGLTAIRRDPPKAHVMDDHASRVVDALRKEFKQLESGD